MKKLKNYRCIQEKAKISPKAFIADGAKLIGAVSIADYSSIWYNTIVRADINKIKIGAYTNIQDLCVLHVCDDLAVRIGNWVTVGHGAILHACTIEDGTLIGMGAIVLNGAHIGKNSMVAAGSLVPPNFVVPEQTLVKGYPAKTVRRLKKSEIKENYYWATKYSNLIKKHRKQYVFYKKEDKDEQFFKRKKKRI